MGLVRTTRRSIPEEGILHSNRRENHKPYNLELLLGYKTKNKQTNKQTPWPLVRERTIPTDRPPLVGEI
jgi:hypothetical protein